MATSTRRPHQQTVAPFGALHRAVHAVQQAVAESEPGLTHPEAVVLAHLSCSGPVTMGQLHRNFGFRKSTATNVVDRLVEAGLATRKPDPEDARSRRVALTATGAKAGKRVLRLFREIEPLVSRILKEEDH